MDVKSARLVDTSGRLIATADLPVNYWLATFRKDSVSFDEFRQVTDRVITADSDIDIPFGYEEL